MENVSFFGSPNQAGPKSVDTVEQVLQDNTEAMDKALFYNARMIFDELHNFLETCQFHSLEKRSCMTVEEIYEADLSISCAYGVIVGALSMEVYFVPYYLYLTNTKCVHLLSTLISFDIIQYLQSIFAKEQRLLQNQKFRKQKRKHNMTNHVGWIQSWYQSIP